MGFEWHKEGGLMGGYWHPLGVQAQAYVNEDGMATQEPNMLATVYTREVTALPKSNVIFGTMIVVCGKAMEGPETDTVEYEDED